jgi:hypothetical protein
LALKSNAVCSWPSGCCSRWFEATAISCIKYHGVRNDQCMFRVNGSLDVVGR